MVSSRLSSRTIVALWRILILTPAAIAVWYLNRTGNYKALIFDGGWTTRFYVVAWIVLTPYLGWFITATGRLTFSLIKQEAAQLVDEFFIGAAMLILIGFGLGALSILFPQLVLGLAVVVLLRDTHDLKKMLPIGANYALLATSMLGFLLLGIIFFDRGVMPDVISTDVQQLYAPYLAEVARNHSIWLAADNPIFSDFEIGHGNGLNLLLATFLPPQVSQIISFLYYVAIGAVIFELARVVLPVWAFGPRWEGNKIAISLGLAILGLAWPRTMPTVKPGLYIMEFGKYHLQTAAFFVYSLLIIVRSSESRDRIAAGISAFSVAVSYPLYAAFLFLISALGMLTKTVQRDRCGLITSVWLGLGATAGCILAFAVNYFYLGIPATNPYSLFRHFVSTDRFSRFGSIDILDYFVLAQSLDVSDFFSRAGLVALIAQAKTVLKVAILLATTVFIVVFADSRLFPDRPNVSKVRLANLAGLFVLVAYVASVRFLDLTLRIPSLIRLSIYVNALFPLVTVALAFWGLTIVWRLAPTWFTGRLAPNITLLMLLIVCAWTIFSFPLRSFRDDGVIQFMAGRPLDQMPRVTLNWQSCDELQQATGLDRILPLNGYRALVPCYFSPLLTRGKIIHTYESDVARDFQKIALGNADTAELTLRSLGVNLFYVQKNNCDFWLNGFADLFQKGELEKRFSVYRETPDYWLLTWKNSDQILDPKADTDISALRTRSKEIYKQAYGIEPFELVKHHLPIGGERGDINVLDKLFKCE